MALISHNPLLVKDTFRNRHDCSRDHSSTDISHSDQKDVLDTSLDSGEHFMRFAEVLYKCMLCTSMPRILTSKANFLSHIYDTHISVKENLKPCSYCFLKFGTGEDLKAHVIIAHHDETTTGEGGGRVETKNPPEKKSETFDLDCDDLDTSRDMSKGGQQIGTKNPSEIKSETFDLDCDDLDISKDLHKGDVSPKYSTPIPVSRGNRSLPPMDSEIEPLKINLGEADTSCASNIEENGPTGRLNNDSNTDFITHLIQNFNNSITVQEVGGMRFYHCKQCDWRTESPAFVESHFSSTEHRGKAVQKNSPDMQTPVRSEQSCSSTSLRASSTRSKRKSSAPVAIRNQEGDFGEDDFESSCSETNPEAVVRSVGKLLRLDLSRNSRNDRRKSNPNSQTHLVIDEQGSGNDQQIMTFNDTSTCSTERTEHFGDENERSALSALVSMSNAFSSELTDNMEMRLLKSTLSKDEVNDRNKVVANGGHSEEQKCLHCDYLYRDFEEYCQHCIEVHGFCEPASNQNSLCESFKIMVLKQNIPEFLAEDECGHVSRVTLLRLVAEHLKDDKVRSWGAACNKAVRLCFPRVIAQRKGKFKNYFFGVQLLNGLAEDEEVIIEQHQPSFVPLRDMVKDTTKLLEHLKDVVQWTGNMGDRISRNIILQILAARVADLDIPNWGLQCNRAVRQTYPSVGIKRKGKHKTTFYFGVQINPRLTGEKELLSLGIDPASYHSEMETSGGDFDVSYSSLNNSSMDAGYSDQSRLDDKDEDITDPHVHDSSSGLQVAAATDILCTNSGRGEKAAGEMKTPLSKKRANSIVSLYDSMVRLILLHPGPFVMVRIMNRRLGSRVSSVEEIVTAMKILQEKGLGVVFTLKQGNSRIFYKSPPSEDLESQLKTCGVSQGEYCAMFNERDLKLGDVMHEKVRKFYPQQDALEKYYKH